MQPRNALFALCLLGCDDPLLEAQRIESLRVLGARIEAAADPDRAWLRPGEAARTRWLIADPRPEPAIGWAFRGCVAVPSDRGLPRCMAAPFFEARSNGVYLAPPSFDFRLPEATAFEGSQRVLVAGTVCAGSEPTLADALENTSCAGELELTLMETRLEHDGATNRNPRLAATAVALGGVPWPEGTLTSREDCSPADASSELPLVTASGAVQRISVALAESDREPVSSALGSSFETLHVSHFSTAGRLDRPVSVIEGDSDDLSVDVDWESPGSTDRARIVRFYFVARDLRGGVDFTVRTLCLVP